MAIDINTYARTPAAVFDLNGECCYSNRNEGVPCRIKVGPRRWLEEYVIPEKLGVTIWLQENGQTTYLRNEPVQASVDKDGVLTVDMASFAKEYFGKEDVHFCDSEHWKWYKNRTWSDTFLTTGFGIAAHSSTWLDISIHHNTLRLLPGTLNLCGHDVRHIYWETFYDEMGAPSEAMRPLVKEILSGPHTASAKGFLKRMKQLKPLQECGFHTLTFSTDRGMFSLRTGLNRSLSIRLNGEDPMNLGYEPNIHNSTLQDIEILLQMLQASDADEIRAKAEEFHGQGLLVLPKSDDRKRK